MTDLASTIVVCITVAASVGVTAYCFLEWMRGYRRKNDLQDKFQGYERATEQRILQLEVLDASTSEKVEGLTKRVDNLLDSQERLVARFGKLDEETKAALADLASKWLAEIEQMNMRQAAAMTAPRAAHTPRFRP